MKNLHQIRAASALASKELVQRALNQPGQGDRLSGFPMLIIQCGLLAAFAFASEPDRESRCFKHAADQAIATAITSHLRSEGIGITGEQSTSDFIAELAAEESDLKLRRATVEAIEFLNYLKRFVA
jgi:CRISPR/Cas system CMR-associated protein Cmr5 small subunit